MFSALRVILGYLRPYRVEVWLLLAGSAIGLSAGTQGRLLASAFYALGLPQAPLRASLVRVSLTALMGWALALDANEHTQLWVMCFGISLGSGLLLWAFTRHHRRELQARKPLHRRRRLRKQTGDPR